MATIQERLDEQIRINQVQSEAHQKREAGLANENTSLKNEKAMLEVENAQLKVEAVEVSHRYAFLSKAFDKIRRGQEDIMSLQGKARKYMKLNKTDKAIEHQREANQLINTVNNDIEHCDKVMVGFRADANKHMEKVKEHKDTRFAHQMGELGLD